MKIIHKKFSSQRLLAMPVAGLLVFGGFAFQCNAATVSASVLDKAGIAITDAVVYVVPRAGTVVSARAPRSVAIEQINREFVPYVTPIQVGASVSFPNRDPLMHHVYSFSSVKNFEIKLYSGEAPQVIVFDKPGVATLGCNIHDWMIGYVFVAETPYFAKTGADGRVTIPDIGAGDFEVRVWHPRQRGTVAGAPVKFDARPDAKSDMKFTVELLFNADISPRKQKFKPPANPIQYK